MLAALARCHPMRRTADAVHCLEVLEALDLAVARDRSSRHAEGPHRWRRMAFLSVLCGMEAQDRPLELVRDHRATQLRTGAAAIRFPSTWRGAHKVAARDRRTSSRAHLSCRGCMTVAAGRHQERPSRVGDFPIPTLWTTIPRELQLAARRGCEPRDRPQGLAHRLVHPQLWSRLWWPQRPGGPGSPQGRLRRSGRPQGQGPHLRPSQGRSWRHGQRDR
jgi:hypothetical protein